MSSSNVTNITPALLKELLELCSKPATERNILDKDYLPEVMSLTWQSLTLNKSMEKYDKLLHSRLACISLYLLYKPEIFIKEIGDLLNNSEFNELVLPTAQVKEYVLDKKSFKAHFLYGLTFSLTLFKDINDSTILRKIHRYILEECWKVTQNTRFYLMIMMQFLQKYQCDLSDKDYQEMFYLVCQNSSQEELIFIFDSILDKLNPSELLKNIFSEMPWCFKCKYWMINSIVVSEPKTFQLIDHQDLSEALINAQSHTHLSKIAEQLFIKLKHYFSREIVDEYYFPKFEQILMSVDTEPSLCAKNIVRCYMPITMSIKSEELVTIFKKWTSLKNPPLYAILQLNLISLSHKICDEDRIIFLNYSKKCLYHSKEHVRISAFEYICHAPPHPETARTVFHFLILNLDLQSEYFRERVKKAVEAFLNVIKCHCDVIFHQTNAVHFFDGLLVYLTSVLKSPISYAKMKSVTNCLIELVKCLSWADSNLESNFTHKIQEMKFHKFINWTAVGINLLLNCDSKNYNVIVTYITKQDTNKNMGNLLGVSRKMLFNPDIQTNDTGLKIFEFTLEWLYNHKRLLYDKIADNLKSSLVQHWIRFKTDVSENVTKNLFYPIISLNMLIVDRLDDYDKINIVVTLTDIIMNLLNLSIFKNQLYTSKYPAIVKILIDEQHPKYQELNRIIWMTLKETCKLLIKISKTSHNPIFIEYGFKITCYVIQNSNHKGVIETAGQSLLEFMCSLTDRGLIENVNAFADSMLSHVYNSVIEENYTTRRYLPIRTIFQSLIIGDRTTNKVILHKIVDSIVSSLELNLSMSIRPLSFMICLYILEPVVSSTAISSDILDYLERITLIALKSLHIEDWNIRNAAEQILQAVFPKLLGPIIHPNEETHFKKHSVPLEELLTKFPKVGDYILLQLKYNSTKFDLNCGPILTLIASSYTVGATFSNKTFAEQVNMINKVLYDILQKTKTSYEHDLVCKAFVATCNNYENVMLTYFQETISGICDINITNDEYYFKLSLLKNMLGYICMFKLFGNNLKHDYLNTIERGVQQLFDVIYSTNIYYRSFLLTGLLQYRNFIKIDIDLICVQNTINEYFMHSEEYDLLNGSMNIWVSNLIIYYLQKATKENFIVAFKHYFESEQKWLKIMLLNALKQRKSNSDFWEIIQETRNIVKPFICQGYTLHNLALVSSYSSLYFQYPYRSIMMSKFENNFYHFEGIKKLPSKFLILNLPYILKNADKRILLLLLTRLGNIYNQLSNTRNAPFQILLTAVQLMPRSVHSSNKEIRLYPLLVFFSMLQHENANVRNLAVETMFPKLPIHSYVAMFLMLQIQYLKQFLEYKEIFRFYFYVYNVKKTGDIITTILEDNALTIDRGFTFMVLDIYIRKVITLLTRTELTELCRWMSIKQPQKAICFIEKFQLTSYMNIAM